jgi:mannose-1-phosphate guanylyltransferase
MTANPFYACILAGGSGERFWPMSRRQTPKHLLQLVSPRPLIEEAVRRLDGVVPPENIYVLTSAAQLAGVRAVLPFIPAAQIVAEPERRDTAPAAALATALVRARDPRGVVALFSADAFIRDREKFAAQIAAAFRFASGAAPGMPEAALLTIGVNPTFPSTGFGYLELGDDLVSAGASGVLRRVRRFVEKPDLETAQRYVAGGGYAWNAGIFLWRAEAFLAEADRSAPELAAFVRGFPSGSPDTYLRERFALLPKISLDYAIMEKAAQVVTLVAAFDWDDVGTWAALPKHLRVDAAGNASRGSVAIADSSRNLAVSNGRVIALCGVHDLVVVETADAVLVCHRDAVQDLKKLQPLLPKEVL